MRRFAVILALMLSGQAFGQSSLFNVPYRPQPRILIPTVEPSQTIVSTNGTVIANTNRALRYCDFYLAAVDQSGAYTNPVLFEFSSVTTNAQSAAVIYYQRSGANWPESLIRRAGTTYCITNWTTNINAIVSGYYSNWNSRAIDYDFHPSYIIISNLYMDDFYKWQGTNYYAANPYYETNATNPYKSCFYWTTNNLTWRFSRGLTITGTLFTATTFTNTKVRAPIETNVWTTNYTTNITSEVFSETIMSIRASSSNEASAIEVYPLRQGQKWMKPTNPDIKWMCLLSNGLGWYSTPAGDPIWFNCLVEWVDKIPEKGVR